MLSYEDEKFYKFLERMVFVTHQSNSYDREAYVQLIQEIGEHYKLARGEAGFYLSADHEARGEGEIFCDFDNGNADQVGVFVRIESKSGAIIIGKILVPEGHSFDDPKAKDHLEMLLRVILGWISRMRLQQKVEEFAYSDEMGYLNFRAFARFLMKKNRTNALGGMVSMYFDLHNYTMVNSQIGRAGGDLVMRNYYNMIAEAIGDTGILCRLGGDKFIGLFDRSARRQVFEILSGVPVLYDEKNGKRIRVSAAAGVFMMPKPFMIRTPGDIMDKIMVSGAVAKNQTDGAIVIFDDKMKSERERIKKVQSAFHAGLEKEEFKVFYQPKVNVETGELVGAEALCRWFQNGKIVPPMEFIPVLEIGTEICDLDFYMLDHVCRDIRRWLDAGIDVVRVSVNFSRKHLVDVDLLEHIMEVLDRNKVPHEYIEVELTETTTDVLFRDLKRIVSGLQEQGVWTAVDDFGMGYSSLNLIREIPWNVLKIDKNFVPKDNEPENRVASLMFKHVTSLAQDMGMECVVEGVETVNQLDVLRSNHCSIAQGYFFDKPLPVEEYEARLLRKYYELPEGLIPISESEQPAQTAEPGHES